MYPGGKSKLKKEILEKILLITNNNISEYREPFVGAGSIFKMLVDKKLVNNIWINDKDVGIYCYWLAVKDYPQELEKAIKKIIPSVEYFNKIKKELLGVKEVPTEKRKIVNIALKTLVIHQTSHSGLGKMGGAKGGNIQNTKIDSRWNPKKEIIDIKKYNTEFKKIKVKITCVDFSFLLDRRRKKNVFIYLDPPYFEKGHLLYSNSFNNNYHKDLSFLLKRSPHKWLLSLDNNEVVRNLYSWANIEETEIEYSIRGHKKAKELFITQKIEK